MLLVQVPVKNHCHFLEKFSQLFDVRNVNLEVKVLQKEVDIFDVIHLGTVISHF